MSGLCMCLFVYQQHVVLFRVAAKVLIDAPRPVFFHVVPIIDNTVSDWVVDVVVVSFDSCFSPDVEVKIFNIILLPHLVVLACGNKSRDDVVGFEVTSVTHLGVSENTHTHTSKKQQKQQSA